MRAYVFAALLLLSAASTSAAELLTNGGFDDPTNFAANDPSGGMLLGAGSRAIRGWTVANGTVLWAGLNGLDEERVNRGAALVNSVLLRSEADAILQTIDILPNMARFKVSVSLRNDNDGDVRDALDLLVDGAEPAETIISTRTTDGSLEDRTYWFNLQPSAARVPSLTLRFVRRAGRGYVAIDGVTAAAVPEPASWALLLGGLGTVGLAMRRRRASLQTV